MTKIPQLKEALSRWAVAKLKQREGSLEELRVSRRPTWVALPSGDLSQVPYGLAWWPPDMNASCDLPQWARVIQVVEGLPDVKRHFDTLVGTDLAAGRWTLYSVALSLLPRPLFVESDIVKSESMTAFYRRYAALEAILTSDEIEHTRVWPVLELNFAQRELVLDDRVRVRPLSRREHLACLNAGLVHVRSRQTYIDIHSPVPWGIEVRFSLAKRIGEGLPDEAIGALVYREEQQITDDLHAMFGVAGRQAILSYNFDLDPFDALGYRTQAGHQQPSMWPRSVVTRAESRILKQSWDTLRTHGHRNPALGLAARRLYYAQSRARLEDRILDTMIAAEALYLSDQEGDRSELRYRLSLRAAMWTPARLDGLSRKQVFDTMMCAYKVRSQIAHGVVPKNKPLSVGGSTLNLDELLNRTTQIVRAGLAKAFQDVAKEGGKFKPEWDSLIIRD